MRVGRSGVMDGSSAGASVILGVKVAAFSSQARDVVRNAIRRCLIRQEEGSKR